MECQYLAVKTTKNKRKAERRLAVLSAVPADVFERFSLDTPLNEEVTQ